MSFDKATGDLWTGNVGQDLWEQIYRIERGGNYGWSVLEGSHPFRPERKRGPTPILMPVVEHDHANFRSITGGFVYHGRRLRELQGSYVYGDYDTGRVWTFRYDREKKAVSDHRELYKSNLRLVCFGEDNDGELYLLDHMGGRISRLVPNPAVNTAGQFPAPSERDGPIPSTREHRPAPGVLPYEVIAPQWCDGASKERFLALPGLSQIEFESITYPQPALGASPGWKFPDGTVLAETLFIETEAGNPASRRRIETRLLHNEQTDRHRGGRRPVLARLHLRLERRADRRRPAGRPAGPRPYADPPRPEGPRRQATTELALPQPDRVYSLP